MTRVPPTLDVPWQAIRRRVRGSSEFDLLARTFLARFFDHDITGGSHDLRASFFWLLAFLAAPGIFMPVLMSFDWDGVALRYGPEGLRILSRGDKVFYLGFAMIATGLVSAIAWSSLLLDRLDGLVLGSLPLSGPRIVRAKLTALCVYVVIVAFAMHTLASCAYGFFLASHSGLGYAWAGTVAHLVASSGSSAFVLFVVAAIQGLTFVAVGPRRFHAISPWLHTGVIGLVLIALVLLPLISRSTVGTLTGGPAAQPWILHTPLLWFLGLYEVVLRTDDPTLKQLGAFALIALASAATIVFVTYPLAYRRLVAQVVAMPAPRDRRGLGARLVEWMVALVSRDSAARASSQFFLAAVRRSTRHRLAIAAAGGITAALVSPTLFRWAPRLSTLPQSPTPDLLALPLIGMLLLLVGLRIAAALPADLASNWVFDSIGAAPRALRAGLWRTLFVAVVVPVTLVVGVTYRLAWGDHIALRHASLCLTVGAVLIELLLWGFEAMPCSRPWRPEHANVRTWWPAYLALFVLVASGVPHIEHMCLQERTGFAALIGIVVAIGAGLRLSHRRRRMIPEDDLNEPTPVQVLNLD